MQADYGHCCGKEQLQCSFQAHLVPVNSGQLLHYPVQLQQMWPMALQPCQPQPTPQTPLAWSYGASVTLDSTWLYLPRLSPATQQAKLSVQRGVVGVEVGPGAGVTCCAVSRGGPLPPVLQQRAH